MPETKPTVDESLKLNRVFTVSSDLLPHVSPGELCDHRSVAVEQTLPSLSFPFFSDTLKTNVGCRALWTQRGLVVAVNSDKRPVG